MNGDWIVNAISALIKLIQQMSSDPRQKQLLAWLEEGRRLAGQGHDLENVVQVTRIAAARIKQIEQETDALARARFSGFPRKD